MEALGIIGIIVLIGIAYVVFGLLGWVVKPGGFVLEFLVEGFSTSWGYLIGNHHHLAFHRGNSVVKC